MLSTVGVTTRALAIGLGFTVTGTVTVCPAASRKVMLTIVSAATVEATRKTLVPETACTTGKTNESEENAKNGPTPRSMVKTDGMPEYTVNAVGLITSAGITGGLTVTATVVDCEAASRMVMVTNVSVVTLTGASAIVLSATACTTGKTNELELNA